MRTPSVILLFKPAGPKDTHRPQKNGGIIELKSSVVQDVKLDFRIEAPVDSGGGGRLRGQLGVSAPHLVLCGCGGAQQLRPARVTREFTGPVRDFTGPAREFTGPVRDFTGPARDFTGSARDFTGHE
eukprot:7700817-Pyramimonas_sp.AAC.1